MQLRARDSRSQRGSALLIALILVGIIGVAASIFNGVYAPALQLSQKLENFQWDRGGTYAMSRHYNNSEACWWLTGTMLDQTGDSANMPGNWAAANRYTLAASGRRWISNKNAIFLINGGSWTTVTGRDLAPDDDGDISRFKFWQIADAALNDDRVQVKLSARKRYDVASDHTYRDDDPMEAWARSFYVSVDVNRRITSCFGKSSPRFMCAAMNRNWNTLDSKCDP